jgi:hypothetical protein
MNLNNIDDIFEEGLAGYSEQPSKGLWKKISGKMLRYELFRLNLTNIPKLWVGIAASGIVAVSLLIIDPFAAEPLENTLSAVNQKDSPITENNQLDENIFILSDAETQSAQEDISTFHPLEPGNVNSLQLADKTIVIDEIKTTDAFTDQTQIENGSIRQENTLVVPSGALPVAKGASVDIYDDALINIEHIEGADVVEQSEEQVGTGDTKIVAEIAGPAVVANIPKPVEGNSQESTAAAKTALGETTQISTDELQEGPGISQLNSRQATLSATETSRTMSELSASGDPSLSAIRLNRPEHELDKIQRMHSKSYSLGQFFKGKYKPPKRRFNEASVLFYKGNEPFYSLEAYFSPELTEYVRTASTSREISYTGGLALSYNKAKFMVEAGLEYSYSNDLGDYLVDMETYDSVGYFNEVGGFVPDPDNPGSVIFETNTVMVYDSVQHNLHQQTQNHYSYLQFPVMIGYQAVERGLFSAYIKAGPSFSFLLNKQEQSLNFYNPDATVNQIKNYTPTRMNTSIQVLVSVKFKFQLSEKSGILVEPTYRYYLKSVYDTQDNSLKNPYGIGVRCGMYFDL